MRLLRVQVPNFRVLKDVDITFEKDFFPSIFPLGSQNGGGKSTLLQLIFVLLGCSSDPKGIPYLRNTLSSFNLLDSSEQRILAKFEILWEDRRVFLEFFIFREDYKIFNRINKLIQLKSRLEEFSTIEKRSSSQEGSVTVSITFLALILTLIEVAKYSREIRELINENIVNIDSFLQEKMLEIVETSEKYRKLTDKDVSTNSITPFYQDLLGLHRELEIDLGNIDSDVIQNLIDDILFFCRRVEDSASQTKENLLSRNLLYVCDYHASNNKQKLSLMCRIDNIEANKFEIFLKDLSDRVFLAAPSTQVFLFLDESQRKLIFRNEDSQDTYHSQLNDAKEKISNLFTYDFLAVDVLVESFKSARDRDFDDAISTRGRYGNHYTKLLAEMELVLGNKKINLEKDLSGVKFSLDVNSESVELYPEDLSHGELKRLSIYMWLKHRQIKDSIVLMDEIEIALHPDWQYQIVRDLETWEPSNQYILATHSYELCQALTPAHVKVLEPRLQPRDPEELSEKEG